MSHKLKANMRVWKLARGLGLVPQDDPLAAILQYCVSKVRSFIEEFPCDTLDELLELAAAKLDTRFLEIYSDEDLSNIKSEFLLKGETGFALLDKELGPEVYAITFRRLAAQQGERQFVSVIDCRGEKAWRAYFSKWHELAHLLTLTSHAGLKFCRTHSPSERQDPEEAVMEVIAGELGFFNEIIQPRADGEISFCKINELRQEFCPEASLQASIIGFVKAWPSSCILVEAGMGYKKRDERRLPQQTFDFMDQPVMELRALHININRLAREAGLYVHQNMRVPKNSVIYHVFGSGLPEAEAVENLNWWDTSTGQCLEDRQVIIKARKNGTRVLALIIPIE